MGLANADMLHVISARSVCQMDPTMALEDAWEVDPLTLRRDGVRLGKGSSGDVQLAYDPVHGKKLALKIVPITLKSKDTGKVRQFKNFIACRKRERH